MRLRLIARSFLSTVAFVCRQIARAPNGIFGPKYFWTGPKGRELLRSLSFGILPLVCLINIPVILTSHSSPLL